MYTQEQLAAMYDSSKECINITGDGIIVESSTWMSGEGANRLFQLQTEVYQKRTDFVGSKLKYYYPNDFVVVQTVDEEEYRKGFKEDTYI